MSSNSNALITGITGQDGSFLADLLIEKGYTVTGVTRGTFDDLGCSQHLHGQIELLRADLLKPETVQAAIRQVRPSEIYHLGAPSFIPESWKSPYATVSAIVSSSAAILEEVCRLDEGTRVFMPASAAMFGSPPVSPQLESTPCRPTNPYAIARLATHQLVGALREEEDLHVSSGILYNHESERRPARFVPRKVSLAAAAVRMKQEDVKLELGSLEDVRDWSFAGDVVRGMWMMLQQERADDYILASGVGHTVADLVNTAFRYIGEDPEPYLSFDPELRHSEEVPAEGSEGVEPSIGSPKKAKEKLGWETKMGFEELIERMVQADIDRMKGGS